MRLRKRTVDKVIDECFWDGFQSGLGDGISGGLEYASTSGLYSYNGVRRIAEQAGYALAQQVLAEHVERLATRKRGERQRISLGFEYKVPATVVAECYGEARLAATT